MEGDDALMLDDVGRWRMGLLVPASDTDLLEWLERYVNDASESRLPADGGAICLSSFNLLPVRSDEPLRGWIGGGFWDGYGQGYPLYRPLELAVTPIAPCDRVEVELYARDARAQNYLVQLVVAITERWPAAGLSLWLHAPKAQTHRLAELKLKTDLSNFALGLEEFASGYHTDGVFAVSFDEQAAPTGHGSTGPSRKRQRTWTVHLHLPGPARPYYIIREFDLTLTGSRMSGKYPLTFTLMRQGRLFPEVAAFGRDFAAWCRDNWRTALVQGEGSQAKPPRLPSAMPEDDPWELIPDHLWDRQALRLWWEGLTCPEIGRRLSQAPKTVRNRLTLLRKAYGTDVVPTNRRRRMPNPKVGTMG
jgi:hypothetical protein